MIKRLGSCQACSYNTNKTICLVTHISVHDTINMIIVSSILVWARAQIHHTHFLLIHQQCVGDQRGQNFNDREKKVYQIQKSENQFSCKE